MRSTILSILFCATSILLTIGCSSREDKWTKMRPEVYPTQGTVRMDGQPLEEAIVVFSSLDGNHSGTGVTDAAGKYRLTTFEDFDGATEGEFQVTVEKNDWIEIAASGPDAGPGGSGGPVKKVPLTPAKYRDFEKSGFTATVTPDGANTFDFDLDSKAK